MIPTYNCADLLRVTLLSVLAQDPGPPHMQIEVVDDRSTTDDPEAVVEALGRGRVGFHRQARNVGISANFTTCARRARGQLVHVLHGDDIVYPGFYEVVAARLAEDPGLDGVVVGSQDIDEHGVVTRAHVPLRPGRTVLGDDFHEGVFSWNPLRAPAVVLRRSVYEELGGYRSELRYCADWDMWKRVASRGSLLYEPTVLVGYRVHRSSDTARLHARAAHLHDMIRSVRIAHRYLPSSSRSYSQPFYDEVSRQAVRVMTGDPRPGLSTTLEAAGIAVEARVRRDSDRVLGRLARRRRRR